MQRLILNYLARDTSNDNYKRFSGGLASDKTLDKVDSWKSWYKGDVESFHNYTVYNNGQHIPCKRKTLNLPKFICETWADLLFNEKCKITIDDKSTSEFVVSVLNKNNFWQRINEYQERKSALGTVCYIPFARNIGAKKDNEDIYINYISIENMLPLAWDNSGIYELAVLDEFTIEDEKYCFTQLFYIDDNTNNYVIENKLFKLNELGDDVEEASLSSIPKYKNLAKMIKTNSNVKPFVVDRLNITNNLDANSPLGISVFANAIEHIKFCDIVFDSFSNEFIFGKKRIMVSEKALQIVNGRPAFDTNDLVFYQLPQTLDDDGTDVIKEIDMSLRTSEHVEALSRAISLVSSQCGLGAGFVKLDDTNKVSGVKTATEVVSENSSLFRTLKKHELILENVIKELIVSIISIGTNIFKKDLDIKAEIKIEFDDSIIIDKETEIAKNIMLVNNNLMSKLEFIKWNFGLNEEEALQELENIKNEMFASTDSIYIDETLE